MLSLNEIRKRLQPMNLSVVAEQTGVSYNAIYRLAKGKTSPKYETVQKVAQWLEEQK
ncbi:transcriptional regulator [Idiomarinaceae phage Phi1M2-2]|uniref:transcriptional regulator n=1 Tax=Idiomarinaceae phage Phi1M2-2 TaxID=1527515 RepID=UPI0004F73637|nr:transcriptional regulator [Idiomarinaceae phage Phi1M2-2]AIM40820.1 putative HTH-XRE transcriptional regulator [Idiomarinaceae phage Phi1M2-2]